MPIKVREWIGPALASPDLVLDAQLFVVDSSPKSFKRMGKTERIGFQIFIDVSFNQDGAMRIIRFRQVTQCGRAWPEPMHFISCKSLYRHGVVINRP